MHGNILSSTVPTCLLASLIWQTGCNNDVRPNLPPPGEMQASEKSRIGDPQLEEGQLEELVSANSRFAFDLYQLIRSEDGNLVYSPYSISLALAMTYAGTRGETESQLEEALHFELGQRDLHPAFDALDLALGSRGQGARGTEGRPFRLHIVNQFFAEGSYRFLDDYLDVLGLYYGAGVSLMDFVGAPQPARDDINQWVEDQTENRIEDLLPQDSITSLTRFVLVNAIYFNARWLHTFEPQDTRDDKFFLLDGREVVVPMMKQTSQQRYAAGDGFEAVELLYDGGELAMLILVPDEGTFETFEAQLDADAVSAVVSELRSAELDLTMPKFEYGSSFGLVETLSELGVTDLFDPLAADLSGMDGTTDLFISAAVHQAFILVDESGTEAAAATGVVGSVTSVPPPPLTVTIDRPFIFAIRDIETNTLLFLGRVLDPQG